MADMGNLQGLGGNMKVTLTFKGPDAVYDARAECGDSDEDCHDECILDEVFTKFLLYKELVDVEFDTDTLTARVLEVKR
jgi:hypothetical protein